MLLTCLTHADARDKEVHPFRGLTRQGWREVEATVGRFRGLISDEAPDIDAIVSSPKARCVETAVLFAKAIGDRMATSELLLEPAIKAGSITGLELHDLANRVGGEHLLVSAHADLARALPPGTLLVPEATRKGWFATRPVLILLNYETGTSWNSAQALACEGLFGEEWRNLLQ